jgi:IS5 family transposase
MDEGKTSATDRKARFGTTNERGRFAFGYKMHVAVDAGSGLVRDMKLTPANVQDVAATPQLLDRADGVVYADRGYDSDGLRVELARRQLGDGLMRRRRGRPLTAAEVLRNHQLSLTRRAVESLFGTMNELIGLAACAPLRNCATPPTSRSSASPSICVGGASSPRRECPRRRQKRARDEAHPSRPNSNRPSRQSNRPQQPTRAQTAFPAKVSRMRRLRSKRLEGRGNLHAHFRPSLVLRDAPSISRIPEIDV